MSSRMIIELPVDFNNISRPIYKIYNKIKGVQSLQYIIILFKSVPYIYTCIKVKTHFISIQILHSCIIQNIMFLDFSGFSWPDWGLAMKCIHTLAELSNTKYNDIYTVVWILFNVPKNGWYAQNIFILLMPYGNIIYE